MGSTVFKLCLMLCTACCCLHAKDRKIKDVNRLTLDEYVTLCGEHVTEGNCYSGGTLQPQYLESVVRDNPQVKIIGEIGFNGGHSSDIFLKTRPDTFVYAFDIMDHKYVRYGKEYVDLKYPGRHVLIEGNSLESIPAFYLENEGLVFDLIFIDGGHAYLVSLNDIVNMKNFADKDTILIVDDLNIESVNRAYSECLQKGIIKEGKIIQSKHKRWAECSYAFE